MVLDSLDIIKGVLVNSFSSSIDEHWKKQDRDVKDSMIFKFVRSLFFAAVIEGRENSIIPDNKLLGLNMLLMNVEMILKYTMVPKIIARDVVIDSMFLAKDEEKEKLLNCFLDSE